MENTRKVIDIKDIILVTLLSALCIILTMVVTLPFMGNVQLTFLFSVGLAALVCGPVYMLMIAKAPRFGTQFLMSFLFSIYYLMTTGLPSIFALILVAGILREALMLGGGYKKPFRLTASYAIHWIAVTLSPVVMLTVAGSQMTETLRAGGYSDEYIAGIVSGYSSPILIVSAILIAIAGPVLGYLLGRKMLKKHFRPAGVAE